MKFDFRMFDYRQKHTLTLASLSVQITTKCFSNTSLVSKEFPTGSNYKQLLDEVFVISRIIKVEVRVISRSRRLRLITLTETLIILDITKTESNNCFIIH